MKASYARVIKYQEVAVAACLFPPACPAATEALSAAMEAERVIEAAAQAYWNEQQMMWSLNLRARCRLPWNANALPYPAFPYPLIEPSLKQLDPVARENFTKRFSALSLSASVDRLRSTAQLIEKGSNEWDIRWTE